VSTSIACTCSGDETGCVHAEWCLKYQDRFEEYHSFDGSITVPGAGIYEPFDWEINEGEFK